MTIAANAISVDLGRAAILHDVDATFSPGTLTGILGPNGAGKSTLVRAILGLLPVRSGEIWIDGVGLHKLTPRHRARAIAYLPQGQTVHWPLRVDRLVALGRLPHLAPLSRIGPQDQAAIDKAMARADVTHLAERDATSLSGGERPRVMLARALAVGAPALIVDEPLAALDPGHQIDVMELLRKEAQDGATVVAVLHDLNMAVRYCDRLILLDQGRVSAAGTPDAVLTHKRLASVYGISASIGKTGGIPAIIPLARVP